MRVLHAVRQFHPAIGGLENFALCLAREQRSAGLQPRVVTLNRVFGDRSGRRLAASELVCGIPVQRIPYIGSNRYPIAPAVLRYLHGADLVHVHGVDFFCDLLAITSTLHRKPLVLSTHGGYFHTPYAKILKQAFFHTISRSSLRAYRLVLASGQNDFELFRRIAPERVELMLNGVDTEKFRSAASRDFSHGFISLGRLASNKGLLRLIDFFDELCCHLPEARLIIAGTDRERLSTALLQRAEQCAHATQIEIKADPTDAEIRALMGACSFFISASEYEGFGLSTVEAMSAGLIPIVSEIPSSEAIVSESDIGLVVDFAKLGPTLQAVLSFVARVSGRYDSASAAAKQASQKYSWPVVARRIVQRYTTALSEPPVSMRRPGRGARCSPGLQNLGTDRATLLASIRQLARAPPRLVKRRLLPMLLPSATRACSPRSGQVRVVGLLSSATGLGQAARLCLDQLTALGYPVQASNVSGALHADDRLPFIGAVPTKGRSSCSLYHLNPPELGVGAIASGWSEFRNSYAIGCWAWELETLPAEWTKCLRLFDAFLVPSRFVAHAVARYTDKPVIVVPHPVNSLPHQRGRDECNADKFRVLYVFRCDSSFERKNPIDLIRAFRLAFNRDRSARLTLKIAGSARHRAQVDRLMGTIGEASNIEVVDELWTNRRLRAEMASADLYASLHRSEGFGLTLAEAIMQGTPVLATNWSGPTDFCLPHCSYLVDYELTRLVDDHPDYRRMAGARWAQPSVEHAAALLCRARSNPAEAKRKAIAQKRAFQDYIALHTYGLALQKLPIEVTPSAPAAQTLRGSGEAAQ